MSNPDWRLDGASGLDRRRALQALIGLPLAVVSLSLASCADIEIRPATPRPSYGMPKPRQIPRRRERIGR